jgi:hypothetical protein
MSIPTEASPSSEQQTQPAPQPTKRSSRRANTAERRATHNAVERLRRETLNGRFLDLAAMLPALAAQRRPSKSAIVNQSIALLTSQRRGRIIAGRELRLIKTENDALRQELNEWRARNSLPRVEEPPRSGDLIALLAVEEEAEGDEEMMNMMINSRRAAFEMGGDDDDYNEDGDEEPQQLSPESAHPYGAGAAMALPVHHKVVPPVHHQQHQQQQQQQAAHYAAAQQQQQQAIFEQQKVAMARAQMAAARANYAPQQQQQQVYSAPDNFFAADMYEYPSAPTQNWSQKSAASSLATPPGTAHGLKEPSPYANTANSAFLSSSPYGAHGHHNAQSLGMFKPAGSTGRARSEDGDSVGESTGSSHFSSVSDLGNMTLSSSPVDHTFSFNMGMMQMPMNMNMNMMVPMMGGGMNGMSGMNMMGMHHAPPSPPHSVSPSGSQPQSRRPSVNIPSAYAGSGNGSKHASPGPSPVPTPTPSQFVGMGLMM